MKCVHFKDPRAMHYCLAQGSVQQDAIECKMTLEIYSV
jgi:hypothetical protein